MTSILMVAICGLLGAVAPQALARDDDEDDFRDLVMRSLTEERSALDSEIREVREELRKLRGRVPRKVSGEVEAKIKKLQAERILLDRINREIPKKIDPTTMNGLAFTAEEIKGGNAKTKTVALGKNGNIQLVSELRKVTKKVNGTDVEHLEVVVNARWNPDNLKNLPKEVTERFTTVEIDSYIKDKLAGEAKTFSAAPIELGAASAFTTGDQAAAATSTAVKKVEDKFKEPAFLRDVKETFQDAIQERSEEIGKAGEKDTELGDATDELSELTGSKRAEALKEKQALLKIMEWAKANPNSSSMEVCAVYKAALSKWEDFPKTAQDECPNLDPKKIVATRQAEEQLSKEQEEAKKADFERWQADFQAAAAMCEAKARMDSMQVASAEVVGQVGKIKDFLEGKVLPRSNMFLTLLDMTGGKDQASEDPTWDGKSMPVDVEILRSLMETVGNTPEESKRLHGELAKVTQIRKETWEKLKASESIQRKAIEQIELAERTGQPLPPLDPQFVFGQTEPHVRQMLDWYQKASALEMALTVEANRRTEMNENRFSSGSTGGSPVPASSSRSAAGAQVRNRGAPTAQGRSANSSANAARKQPLNQNQSGTSRPLLLK